jgi:hypothetical protein
MTSAPAEAPRLYHLVQAALWDRAVQSKQPYFPPTYAQVHATQHVYMCLLVYRRVTDCRVHHAACRSAMQQLA